MRPKHPKHKQRDMSIGCRHHDTGLNVGMRSELRSERVQWRNLRVKLVRAANAPKASKPKAKPRTVEVLYLRAEPARLDADGTAQPKTRLLAHVRLDGKCRRMDHAGLDDEVFIRAS